MVSAGQVIRAADVAVQACRVTRTTAQSLPDASTATVNFDDEAFDTDGMHDVATNNSRITINEAGIYIVGFNGDLTAGTDYTRIVVTLVINGTTGIARSHHNSTTSSVTQVVGVNTVYQFQAGDYVEVQIFQDNTANTARDLLVTADRSPVFYAARIGS